MTARLEPVLIQIFYAPQALYFWFPRSRVEIHTSIDTLIRVSIPTQERGKKRKKVAG